nr:tyrosine-type recombinase/integrase [Rhizobium sp. T1473]
MSAASWRSHSRRRISVWSPLLREELQAVLDTPDPATRDGIRDRAMLHLAVCAGLRVSELTGLNLEDIDLSSMSIRVLGKGRRERTLPLWKTTAAALRAWLAVRGPGCSARGVRQCPGRAAEPMGLRLSAQTACSDCRSSASRPSRAAQAHMRDDHPASNAGHPLYQRERFLTRFAVSKSVEF